MHTYSQGRSVGRGSLLNEAAILQTFNLNKLLLFFFSSVAGFEPRASCMLSKHCTTDHTSSPFYLILKWSH